MVMFNPFALRKSKIVYNFGLSECNRVKVNVYNLGLSECNFGLSECNRVKVNVYNFGLSECNRVK